MSIFRKLFGGKAAVKTLQALLTNEWTFLPESERLRDFDDATKTFKQGTLRNYRGWLCAVCKEIACDDSCSVLVHVLGGSADEQVQVTQFVICRACMGKHTESELVNFARQGQVCNAVRIADTKPETSNQRRRKTPCSKHPQRDSIAMCAVCHSYVCDGCLRTKLNGQMLG